MVIVLYFMWKYVEKVGLMIVIKMYGNVDEDDDNDDDGGCLIMIYNKGDGCFIINWFLFCEMRDERKYWLKRKLFMLLLILKVKGIVIVNIIYYNYVFVFWILKKYLVINDCVFYCLNIF